MRAKKPSRKAIFDALTCDSAAEGCDGDWRIWVLETAEPEDVAAVKKILAQHSVLSEAWIDIESQTAHCKRGRE